MAKYILEFIRDHKVINPATTLTGTYSDGSAYHIADIPESTYFYPCGKRVVFNRKKDAQAFLNAMGGAAQAII